MTIPTQGLAARFGRNIDPVPWRPLQTMDDYLLDLRAQERSKDYIRMVRVGLSYFSEFLRNEGITSVEEVERMHIVRFQAHLNDLRKPDGTQYALSYRSKMMAYIKGWFTWLERSEFIEKNPWVNIRVVKVPKISKPLEDDEIIALFEAHKRQAFQLDPFSYHRREVILTLLYSWGLRVHELCSINLPNVDLSLDSVRVRNKGGGYKQLPYGEVEKTVVSRWFRHRARHQKREEDALLISQTGGRISPQKVWEIISDLGKRAGVPMNPHRFRDTLGTTMLSEDVPVEIVMKILGHTRREQTLAYAKVRDPSVQRAHERVMQPHLNALLRFDTKE